MISIVIDPDLRYPDPADHFSPDERFPDYRLGHISARPNPVYRAVRDLFVQAGLDAAHLGTADWNPLGEYVRPGSRVFLLCNFMQERRADESREDFFSRCSHGSVIRALADYVLIAAGDTGHVSIGNAPIQFCDWEAVLRDTEAREVLDFYASAGAPVAARDLRLKVTAATRLGAIRSVERRDETEGVHVRLDGDSLFAGQDAQRPRYRVMNYDPRRTQRFHEGGRHEYVIHREILESDVIVSAVKLKTHEKVGITCGIKGMVGTVAHKDSLPHHRYGPPDRGGDEYPSEDAAFARLATGVHELVQRTTPDSRTGSALRVGYKVLRRAVRSRTPVVEGAWHGNDTTWRMATDVARIAVHADAEGVMHKTPQRRVVVLTDGVIGGEGDGPYMSTAVHSGILALADDLAAADHANALLMGFDPDRIPLVREAARLETYPLTDGDPRRAEVTLNGRAMPMTEFGRLERTPYEPETNWRAVLGRDAVPTPDGPDATAHGPRAVSEPRRPAQPAPAVVVPADRPAALGIARSLGSRGVTVYGVDSDPLAPAMASRHVTPVRLPRGDASDETRLRALLDLGRRLGRRAVLFPVSDSAALLCSRHRDALREHYHFVMPEADALDRLLSKDGLHELAEEHGIPAPRMFPVANREEAETIADRLPYPVIIKPVFSPSWQNPEVRALLRTTALGGGPKVVLCRNAAELLAAHGKIAAHDPRMIFEEVIPGEDPSLLYHCFYLDRDSRPLATFAGRKLRLLPVGFGSASFVQSVHDPELERLSLDLLAKIRYQGLGGVEFKRDARDGRLKLIEFNARYGMWDSLGVRCGVDIPWAAYRDALGEPVEPRHHYRTGVKWVDLQRDARAFLQYRSAGRLGSAGWLRSLLGEKDWAYFDRRDWRPAVLAAAEQARALRRLAKDGGRKVGRSQS